MLNKAFSVHVVLEDGDGGPVLSGAGGGMARRGQGSYCCCSGYHVLEQGCCVLGDTGPGVRRREDGVLGGGKMGC